MKRLIKKTAVLILLLMPFTTCTNLEELGLNQFADAITNAINATNGNIQTLIVMDSPTNGQYFTNLNFAASGYAISEHIINRIFVYIRPQGGTTNIQTVSASIMNNGSSINPYLASITVSQDTNYEIWSQVHDFGGNVAHSATNTVQVNSSGAPTPAPEIAIYQNTTFIGDNVGYTHNFGTNLVNTTGPSIDFIIENSGDAALYITNVTSPQPHFTVTASSGFSIPAHSSNTFSIQFDPSTTGNLSDTITVYNSDSSEGIYTFGVSGYSTNSSTPQPDLKVYYQTAAINSGTVYTNNFGSILTNQATATRDFILSNAGTADVSITSIADNSAHFQTGNVVTTLSAGTFTNFSIYFQPASSGYHYSTISINNDHISPFTFIVQGQGTNATTSPEPEIAVYYNGTQITSGSGYTNNMGSWLTNQSSSTFTFTVSNLGTGPLSISSIVDTSTQFTTENLVTMIGINSAANFDVTFNASAAGTYPNQISINNDDTDENPFTFYTTATATNASSPSVLTLEDSDTDAYVTDSSGFNPSHAGLDFDKAVISNTASDLFVSVSWSDLSWWNDTADPSYNSILILIDDLGDSSGGTSVADVDGFTYASFGTIQNGTFEYFLYHNPTGWSLAGGGQLKKVAFGTGNDTIIEDFTQSPTKWSVTPQDASAATQRDYSFSLSDLGLSSSDQVKIVVIQYKHEYWSTPNVADVVGIPQLANPVSASCTYDITSITTYTID